MWAKAVQFNRNLEQKVYSYNWKSMKKPKLGSQSCEVMEIIDIIISSYWEHVERSLFYFINS